MSDMEERGAVQPISILISMVIKLRLFSTKLARYRIPLEFYRDFCVYGYNERGGELIFTWIIAAAK